MAKERENQRKKAGEIPTPKNGDWLWKDLPLIRAITDGLFESGADLKKQMAVILEKPNITEDESWQILADTFRKYMEREPQPERFDNEEAKFVPWLDWLEKYDPVTLTEIHKLISDYPPALPFQPEEPQQEDEPRLQSTPEISGDESDDERFLAMTHYDEDLPSWFTEETQDDDHAISEEDNNDNNPEENYPVKDFVDLWRKLHTLMETGHIIDSLDRTIAAFDVTRFPNLADMLKRFYASVEYTSTEGALKRVFSTDNEEYIKMIDFGLVLKHIRAYWDEISDPMLEETEGRWRLMAKWWVWLADSIGEASVIRKLDLPRSGVILEYPILSALEAIRESYRAKVKDLQKRLMEATLATKLQIEYAIEVILSLAKLSEEYKGMRYSANQEEVRPYNPSQRIKMLEMAKRMTEWGIPKGINPPDPRTQEFSKFLITFRRAWSMLHKTREIITSVMDSVKYIDFRFKKGGNVTPHFDVLSVHSGNTFIEHTYVENKTNTKRSLRLTSSLKNATYSIPILEEGVDQEEDPPTEVVKGVVQLSHTLQLDLEENYFDLSALPDSKQGYTPLYEKLTEISHDIRSEKTRRLLNDMREWLLQYHKEDTFAILAPDELPRSISPTDYSGDWNRRPLSFEELALLASENHFLKEGEDWLAGWFLEPDEETLNDETTWDPMYRFTRQRIWADPPLTIKVYPDDPIIPPEFYLRVVLRGSTTRTEVSKAENILWVVGGSGDTQWTADVNGETTRLIDSSELGQRLGKRWNLWLDQGEGIKNHILAWMSANKDKIFRTNTVQWIVTVNSNMTRGFMHTQHKSPEQFDNWVKYFLMAPSEEFIRGRRAGGIDQANVTLKNILRWNLTKTVIEYSPSKGLVHFHGLLEVTYCYCTSQLVDNTVPPLILDYKAFINYMQLYTAGAYVNFTTVKKFLDENQEKDFAERWEKYIRKGVEQAAKAGTSFVGIANSAVKKRKRSKTFYEYNKTK